MKAVVYERYGQPDVLELRDIPTPRPRPNEVLIRVHASTVTSGDWRARSLSMPAGFGLLGRLFFGIGKPRQPVLGTELAGRIEAVGKDVTRFKVGERVFAFPGASMGSHAEYRCMPEDGLIAHTPDNLTDDQATALSFGGTTALTFFAKAGLAPGDHVLVNGASGGVGTAAVQLALHFGARVTAVCSSANMALVRSLGAEQVIDYQLSDFTKNGQTYDVIVDTVGTAPFARSNGSLKAKGRLLLVLGGLSGLLKAPWQSLTSGKRVIAGPANVRREDLQLLAQLAQAGKFKAVVDRSYPLEQIRDAHRYVDTGRKKGNVIVTFQHAI